MDMCGETPNYIKPILDIGDLVRSTKGAFAGRIMRVIGSYPDNGQIVYDVDLAENRPFQRMPLIHSRHELTDPVSWLEYIRYRLFGGN